MDAEVKELIDEIRLEAMAGDERCQESVEFLRKIAPYLFEDEFIASPPDPA